MIDSIILKTSPPHNSCFVEIVAEKQYTTGIQFWNVKVMLQNLFFLYVLVMHV